MEEVIIRVNDREVTTASGKTLLQAVMDAGIPIDTACGGAARCHLCRVTITDGRDDLSKANPVEYKALGNVLIAQGWRLACQVEVTRPLAVTVPAPRPRRRHGPPPPRPTKPPVSGEGRAKAGHPESSRKAVEARGRPPSGERARDEQPRAAVSSEEPRKKKRRRRRPRRRRSKSEGS